MKVCAKGMWVGLAVLGFATWANAAAVMTISDGLNPLIAVTDNGSGDLSSGAGIEIVVTNVGVWNLTITSGETQPALGSATNPMMDLVIQASSVAAGNLTLTFSANNFGPATGILNASFSGHVVSGAGETVGYNVYGDPTNVLGATTVAIATIGPVGLPVTTSATGSLTLGAPYSLTEVVSINTAGATSGSLDASFNVVAEPSTFALVGVGLLGVLAIRRKM
jgi:hypothetical protein